MPKQGKTLKVCTFSPIITTMNALLKFIKDWTLPLAMIAGCLFYKLFDCISFLTPYLIFGMLMLTFAKLPPRKVRLNPLHLWLVIIQVAGSLLIYFALFKINGVWAESALICVLAPTATSAAVVTGMLGGSVACLTTYTLISNLMVAISAPVIFSLIGSHSDMAFMDSFLQIAFKVGPLLILPLLVAWGMQRFTPKAHAKLIRFHGLAFYLWALALMIVTGKTISFLVKQENPNLVVEILIATTSLIICVAQFATGRIIGTHYKKTIAGGQGLGQKNTVLAIWMAQVFLSPVASLGPASYVLWQNIINSWQLWQKRKKSEAEKAP
jgi:bile acid:Na+ symporter, BASS family